MPLSGPPRGHSFLRLREEDKVSLKAGASSTGALLTATFVTATIPVCAWLVGAGIYWVFQGFPRVSSFIVGMALPLAWASIGAVLWIGARTFARVLSATLFPERATVIETILAGVVGFVASFWIGRDDLVPFVSRKVSIELRVYALIALQGGLGLSLAACHHLGVRMAAQRRFVALAVALLLSLINQVVMVGHYTGLHFFAAAGAWLLAATAILPHVGPVRLPVRVCIVLAAVGACGISIWGLRKFRIATDLRATSHVWMSGARNVLLLGSAPAPGGRSLAELDQLSQPRAGSVTAFGERTGAPVLVLLTVDALRADLLLSEKHRAKLPHLFALKQESVFFSQARSNAPATAVSLAALFLGKVFSEIHWKEADAESDPRGYGTTEHDPTVRIGRLLLEQNVRSAVVAASPFLEAHALELIEPSDPVIAAYPERHTVATAPEVLKHVSRLVRESHGSYLVYAHLMDPHAPYVAPGHHKNSFSAYLEKVRLVDHALGRLLHEVDSSSRARDVFVIISSDHGEAFGEHGASFHAGQLYEEALRVPLLLRTPSRRANEVDIPVSLLDLRSTVLDLLGVDSPHSGLGDSLVPLMISEGALPPRATIVESGTRKRAAVFPNGLKLIQGSGGLFELYDLQSDPKERRNLMDEHPRRNALIAGFRTFFEERAFREQGYTAPVIRP